MAAIRRGDLAGVRAAAAELGHQVKLADALAIVLVMADHRDRRYERAAVRWPRAWPTNGRGRAAPARAGRIRSAAIPA